MSQETEFFGKLKRIFESQRISETVSWLFRGRGTDQASLDFATGVTTLAIAMCKEGNRAVVYTPPLLFVKKQTSKNYNIFAKCLNKRETRLLDQNPEAKTSADAALALFSGFSVIPHSAEPSNGIDKTT